VMGVASGAEKVGPIRAALRGNYLKSLVVDEETANAVLNNAGSIRNVA
ncbi:MAG: sugar-binding transcriptional regulator, partial [Mesorhizobium sp.]